MNELTREWIDKAELDFTSADLLLHAGETPLSDPACFHCQQCAEKYLKGYLQELDRYAVIVRYPGIIIKAETAELALKAVEQARRFTRLKLGLE